jgi:predicted dehydrogenase/threonine dehydrogenase-like Zn-dependent dehydrogenase
MKQVTQRLRDGRIDILDVPPPSVTPDTILVDVRASVLSPGTERSRTAAAQKGLVGKARARPEEARQVVLKLRQDGVRETVSAVRLRLDQPTAIGYSSAGVVLAVGSRARGFKVGDRVACGGADAVHADINAIPANLAVHLPNEVSFDHGAFTTVGSIALQGVRQSDVRLGERVAVIGLGLVGQLAAQVLRAAGCTVLGIDLDEDLVQIARNTGAVDAAYTRSALREEASDFRTYDAVIITAASASSDPIELAAELCRDRGRVVVVGDVGMDVPRARYYEKELELRLSRSYGPGRYDAEYEERGLDYPIGYVRWTERRNMEAFVGLVAAGKLHLDPLISRRVPVADAATAYEAIVGEERSPLGIVLTYDEEDLQPASDGPAAAVPGVVKTEALTVGVIGAGSFAQRILIPALRDAGFHLRSVASARGLSAKAAADRFGFNGAVTVEEMLSDPAIGTVVIASRHGSHAALATAALRAGKAVFVEKPPATTTDDLLELHSLQVQTRLMVSVGFNRRFAPLAIELRRHVRGDGPIALLYRVNAGRLPDDHWINHPEVGGGRLIGEGCHFIDFACWVVGALPARVTACVQPDPGVPIRSAQSFTVSLDFADRSFATITYAASGAPSLSKEYVEAHAHGRSAILVDFTSLRLADTRRTKTIRSRARDKGHASQLRHLHEVLRGEAAETAPDVLGSMGVTLAALRAAECGSWLAIRDHCPNLRA